MRFEVLTAVKL